MLAFTLRRAMQAIGVMIAVGIIAFSMFRFAGDPVNQIVSIDTSAAERAAVRKSLGLDDPVVVAIRALFRQRGPVQVRRLLYIPPAVSNLLVERMPATLELAICATIFAMVFGILMGVYSALRRDAALAKIFQAVSLIGISLPTFLIGILLIYLFSVTLGWLPSFGRGDVVRLGWWTTGLLTLTGLKALILPSITLGLFQLTLIMRLVRARDAGGAAHRLHPLLPAPAGLTTRAIHIRPLRCRNTLVPVITVAGLQVWLGNCICESSPRPCFQWPGWGCCSCRP
jgi:peptide/nickel transport system permease protein